MYLKERHLVYQGSDVMIIPQTLDSMYTIIHIVHVKFEEFTNPLRCAISEHAGENGMHFYWCREAAAARDRLCHKSREESSRKSCDCQLRVVQLRQRSLDY